MMESTTNLAKRPGIRIAIIGTSCSGKSTLANRLSKILNCDHIEIDKYAWNPGWIKRENAHIIEDIKKATQSSCWVTCGNYRIARDIVWKDATHLVWIMLPIHIVLWRALKRTLRNIITKQQVAGENRETFFMQFCTKQSIFVWIFRSHWKRKKEYPPLLMSGSYDPLEIIILKSPKEVECWVTSNPFYLL